MNELKGQLMFSAAADIIETGMKEKYQSFTEKFKDAKTTDDCYTPPAIYDAIADWVSDEYRIDKARFSRPFYPGGDYQREDYTACSAVVDNPPFSILASIIDWYNERGVPFFLFAPTLTAIGLLNAPKRRKRLCVILAGAQITYENGANVQTSFVTNMDRYAVRIEPELYAKLQTINRALQKENKAELPKYEYPSNVLSGKDYALAKYGQTLRISFTDCVPIRQLDAMKPEGKTIFGGGLLLSERAAAERAAAERAAAERAAVVKWRLSDREWAIVREMAKE